MRRKKLFVRGKHKFLTGLKPGPLYSEELSSKKKKRVALGQKKGILGLEPLKLGGVAPDI